MLTSIFSAERRERDWLRYLIAILILVFPPVAATVKEGSGIVFALLFLMGLVWGWPAWKNICVEEKWLFYGFCALFFIASISLVNTQEMNEGIRKLERFLYFVCSIPIYLLLRRYGDYVGRALLLGCVVAGFVYAGEGWYETSILGHELASGAYHKIIFGDIAILISVLLLVASFSLPAVSTLWRIVIILAASSALYASILSMTRGAWLLLPVALLLVLWFYRSILSKRLMLTGLVALLCIATIVIVMKPERIVVPIENGIADIHRTLEDPSVPSSWGERLIMWRDAITIWESSPILGTGIGDYESDRLRLKEEGLSQFPKSYGHAHSIYFDALATMGTIGIVGVVVFLFLLPLWILLRQRVATGLLGDVRSYHLLSALIIIVSFSVFGLTEGWLSRNAMVKAYLLFFLVSYAQLQFSHRVTKS